MKTLARLFLSAATVASIAPTAQAARLASACTLMDDPNAIVEGMNIDKRLPIASVSKMATTWLGVTSGGLDYRFPTSFHVSPTDKQDEYDIHIEGSRDPYLGREFLQVAISELNKRGIKRIRTLTFDENFKFFISVTSESVAAAHYVNESPLPSTVLAQLKSMSSILKGWKDTASTARDRGVSMVGKPEFEVHEIAFEPTTVHVDPMNTRVYLMKSSPLETLVKEMNRNSNNHAANQIFEHFGGASAFAREVSDKLGLSVNDIRFLNGSGDRVDTASGAQYNEASCSAMVHVIRSLRQTLRSQGKDLQNVMAVAGRDLSSTTSRLYTNDQTRGALLAKTGTINPDITLAGLAHTKKGDLYFMYNVQIDASRRDTRSARALIRDKVTEMIRQHQGGDPISYKHIEFMNFDVNALFAEELAPGDKS